jgi:hypothetical protein
MRPTRHRCNARAWRNGRSSTRTPRRAIQPCSSCRSFSRIWASRCERNRRARRLCAFTHGDRVAIPCSIPDSRPWPFTAERWLAGAFSNVRSCLKAMRSYHRGRE